MEDAIVVVGAGGFGREVLDVIRAINEAPNAPTWTLRGVADDNISSENRRLLSDQSVEYLGTTGHVIETISPIHYVVGIGSPTARSNLAARFDKAGWKASTLLHPSATWGFGVTLGDGTIVCAGARLTTNIVTGKHVHLDSNVTVGHDTVLHDYVRLNPASSVSGDCLIGEGALIGAGAVIVNQVTVGAWSTVGAGACVTREVPSEAVVMGVPAR